MVTPSIGTECLHLHRGDTPRSLRGELGSPTGGDSRPQAGVPSVLPHSRRMLFQGGIIHASQVKKNKVEDSFPRVTQPLTWGHAVVAEDVGLPPLPAPPRCGACRPAVLTAFTGHVAASKAPGRGFPTGHVRAAGVGRGHHPRWREVGGVSARSAGAGGFPISCFGAPRVLVVGRPVS